METIQQKAVRLAYLAEGENPDGDDIDHVVAFLEGDSNFALDCKILELAIAEEREACAIEADRQSEDETYGHAKFRCVNIAGEIRARGAAPKDEVSE